MRHALASFLLLVCGTAGAVTCRNERWQGLDFTLCRVDLATDDLRLVLRDGAGRPYATFAALEADLAKSHRTLAFAMNAGMYQEDLSPLGLYVSEGRELAKLNRRTGRGNFYQLPNGVFLIDAKGARVLTTADYLDEAPRPRLATQSGPMLVHAGEIVVNSVVNPGSQSRRVRNGVCAPSPGSVAFAISDGAVTFHQFAGYFRDRLGCREALYLDGSISSLFSKDLGRSDRSRDLGPMFAVAR